MLCNLSQALSVFAYPHPRTCLLTIDRGREGEKHGSAASHTCPNWGLNPHPRHLP